MYRTPVIIEKISPDRANRTQTRSGGVLLRHEGAYFTIMTGKVLYIIPLITRLLPKTKQFIYNVFVTSIHSVYQQRNCPPKTLTSSLSNRQRLGWYISRLLHWRYRTSCGVLPKAKSPFVYLDSGHYSSVANELSKNNWPLEVVKCPCNLTERWKDPCNKHIYLESSFGNLKHFHLFNYIWVINGSQLQ